MLCSQCAGYTVHAQAARVPHARRPGQCTLPVAQAATFECRINIRADDSTRCFWRCTVPPWPSPSLAGRLE